MKNKIIAHLSIIMILMGVFCNVCTMGISLSRNDKLISYASADNWDSCDTSDLVTAFRYYCKSRNLALEGSAVDALTSFTTNTFNNLCSTLGIDPTTLSAELKKTTEGNLGLRFLFSNTGITAYNRIFAEFLQNNDLSVGDEVENKNIYSGKSFANHLLYIIPNYTDANHVITNYTLGSSVSGLNGSQFVIGNNYSFTYNNKTYSLVCNELDLYSIASSSPFREAGTNKGLRQAYSGYGTANVVYCPKKSHNNGCDALIYRTDRNELYYGVACLYNGGLYCALTYKINLLEDDNLADTTVNVTTNNNTINNNTYNNNYTIIYNDGDTYISDDDDEPLPTTPPSGGGGGGGDDNPDNPDNPDIPTVDPTPTPPPKVPDWDIELPEMPTGNDWLLYGLEKKFPWDIPFNLMYMLSLFAADPETPHFEGTLDLKIVQWNYDINLAPFDDIAEKVRNFEFIGFLLGLMLLTRKLIWG